MTPRDLRNIHTTGNSCRDALWCANMALKLPRYFDVLMEKPLGRYLQVRLPYYQAAHCNQKTHSRVLKVAGQVWESQKKMSINASHSCHQRSSPKPVSTDLTINLDSVLTNPIGKDGVYPMRHFYRDSITRRVAHQG